MQEKKQFLGQMKRLFDVPKLKKKLSFVNKDDFHFFCWRIWQTQAKPPPRTVKCHKFLKS